MFESDRLSRQEIQYWRRRAHREFYLRPAYVWRRLTRIRSAGDLRVTFKGLSMLARNIRKGQ